MHWNVAPDALPGSARLIRILDHWLNDCMIIQISTMNIELCWGSPNSRKGPQNHNEDGGQGSLFSCGPQNFITLVSVCTNADDVLKMDAISLDL